jgi:hypothetical protein
MLRQYEEKRKNLGQRGGDSLVLFLRTGAPDQLGYSRSFLITLTVAGTINGSEWSCVADCASEEAAVGIVAKNTVIACCTPRNPVQLCTLQKESPTTLSVRQQVAKRSEKNARP